MPFVVFIIAATAELNRPPFDLVEAEQELVGGFHTEYCSIRFALFYLAEFMNTVMMSAIIVTLFLGGPRGRRSTSRSSPAPSRASLWFLAKLLVFLFVLVWFRATLPRFRYDQLMDLGWKLLIPLALGWFLLIAALRVAQRRRAGTASRGRRSSRSSWRSPATALLTAGAAGQRPAARELEGTIVLMGYLEGFLVTLRQIHKLGGTRVTTQYSGRLEKRPATDEKIAKPERLHGRHVLNRYEDGMEKCIGCELCAGVCPARCIYVRGADNPPDDPVSPGRALRLRLRDQLPAVHPLRPVRRGVPHRGHHRDEAVRVLLHEPARRHLHQGRAARRRRRPAAAAAVGGLARGRGRATPRAGCGPPRRRGDADFEGGWRGRASSATACAPRAGQRPETGRRQAAAPDPR